MTTAKRDRAAYNREWRHRNAEKLKVQAAARRAANPERYRAASRRFRDQNPGYGRRNYAKNIVTVLLAAARKRAVERGIEFDLRHEDVVMPTHCPILGVPLLIGGGHGFRNTSPSLDRIDNSRGYVRGNVAVVSFRANRIKSDATLAELRLLVAFLEQRAAGVFG